MYIISINLFFEWSDSFLKTFECHHVSFLSLGRFVQNLVFYGISQSTGSWGFDPYCKLILRRHFVFFLMYLFWSLVSFTISALVEILSCIAIHPILNRVGRKVPYFIAAVCFAVVALGTIFLQNLLTKDAESRSKFLFNRYRWERDLFFRTKMDQIYYEYSFKVFCLGKL